MSAHLYLEGRDHCSVSSSIAYYITLFRQGVSHLIWSLKIWLAKLARKSPGPPVSLPLQWLCCIIWWILTKAYTWTIPIPVWDEAMSVPPGNSCKHAIANPISAAAKGSNWSGLYCYSLAASRMFCGKGYCGSSAGCWLLAADYWLLAALPGVLVFRVPTIWMYQGFNPFSFWEAFHFI